MAIEADQVQIQPGDRLQYQRAPSEVVFPTPKHRRVGQRIVLVDVQILLQLDVVDQQRDLIGEVELHVPPASVHGIEQVGMQRGHIGGETADLPAIADGDLGDAEVDVEVFQLEDVVVDLVAKAAGVEVLREDTLAGDGRGIADVRHTARPGGIAAG